MTAKDWWKVENLIEHEKRVTKINNLHEMDEEGDFGSYRKVLKGANIENTSLASHNDLNPGQKIRTLNKLMSLNNNQKLDILDVGCGMGFTSYEISKFYKNSNVTGVDVSTDAIKYAKNRFKNVKFICQGVDPTRPSLDKYDLICCFEFYPFTRTNSIQIHKDYLSHFLAHLKKHGKLIISLKWNNIFSIHRNIDDIAKEYNLYRFDLHTIPSPKLTSFLGNNNMTFVLDNVLRLILRKDHSKFIIVSLK